VTEVSNVTFGRTGIAGSHDPLYFARFSRLRDRTDGGGGTDDDSSDDDMEDSSDDDEEDEDDEDDSSDDSVAAIKRRDGKPATQKDFDALQEALRKERAKNRKRRGAEDKTDDKSDDDASEKAAKAEREKWKPMVVRQAATSALSEAGLVLPDDPDDRRRALKRALRLLDLGDVEVDDDGDVDGLDDAIADLKDDMPELFTRKRASGKINGADRRERGDGKAKTASEIQAQGLLGKGR
jgi:hypothetical protein